jgi:hypothetical protein
MSQKPLVEIMHYQFVATYRALCRILTEYRVEHEELHKEAESDWMYIIVYLERKWV